MKKSALMGVLLTTLLVSVAASAHAQSNARVAADITFNFQIGDETLPAGEYIVRPTSPDGDTLLIIGKNGSKGRFALGLVAKNNRSARPRMVFHRYGDQYFLREVWGSEREGRTLIESGRERKLRRELVATAKQHGTQMTGPDIVVVAAHYEAR